MNNFKFTAEQSLGNNALAYAGNAAGEAAPSIEGAIDFLCLLKCGAGALGCIKCGTNIGCWVKCAGPVIADCVKSCF